jgi:ABC-type maltose transport system permease subunit
MTATPLGRTTPALPPPRKSLLSHRAQRLVVRTIGWAILAIVLLIALFPVYFMTLTAFHPPSLSTTPAVFTLDLKLSAFRELFRKYPFMLWMRNTFMISFFSTLLS